jgi:TIR domain
MPEFHHPDPSCKAIARTSAPRDANDQRPARRIFISYRRTDTPHIAGRLFDRLVARFGAANVFIDVDSIEPGVDYTRAIFDAIDRCDVLLALIGMHWLDAVDEHSRRRLDDPDDLVGLEISTALERPIRVVPVLVDGAAAPRRADLPDVLALLAHRQSVRLNHLTFSAGVTALIASVERAPAVPPCAEADDAAPRPGHDRGVGDL